MSSLINVANLGANPYLLVPVSLNYIAYEHLAIAPPSAKVFLILKTTKSELIKVAAVKNAQNFQSLEIVEQIIPA